MRKNIIFLVSLFVLVVSFGATLFAQERTGSIEGTIKDTNGAVIPNATVEVTGNAFSRTVTTNGEGYFRIPAVPPGSYKVVVSSGNFDKVTKNDVPVTLGNAIAVDVELKPSVGAVVNVTSEGVATIDATSSKIQTNLGEKALSVLPKGTGFTSALKAAAPVRNEP